jgi:hypothetical protein
MKSIFTLVCPTVGGVEVVGRTGGVLNRGDPKGSDAMWLDISYSDNILLFRHLLHGHFASRCSPAKASFRKFFTISSHLVEWAPLSLNLSYIACRSLAIFNTVSSLHDENLVFIVNVSSLQQELRQSEFIVYVFSSSRNNWNYVHLSNLIGTKNVTSCF